MFYVEISDSLVGYLPPPVDRAYRSTGYLDTSSGSPPFVYPVRPVPPMPNEDGTLGERLWGIPEVTETAPESRKKLDFLPSA